MESKDKIKLLIADDDQEIREILTLLFTGEGYEVVTAKDGIQAVEMTDEGVDLIILDINMPEKSGYQAGSEIRKKSFVPIIFLSAYTQESDKTMGYSVGADDYVTKPFSNSELLLKVKAMLRRCQVYQPLQPKEQTAIEVRGLSVNLQSQAVSYEGRNIILTHTEYKILELLLRNRKKIFSIDHIYSSVWDEEAVGDNAVMVHIKNLRKKLEPDPRNPLFIKTAWGRGYYIE